MTRRTSFSSTHPALHALLAVIGPVIFLVCEAISAIAWRAGTYDYGRNFISDLGTTICGSTSGGRELCSPLHGVMNFGFVAMGLAIGASAILLATRVTRERLGNKRRIALIALGFLNPFGMVLVASFHSQDESVANGTIWLHAVGAVIAITAGNALGLVAGPAAEAFGFPRWYSPVSIVLGVVGLVAMVFIAVEPPPFDPAIYERIAVYVIFVWHFATAFCLLRAGKKPSRTIPLAR